MPDSSPAPAADRAPPPVRRSFSSVVTVVCTIIVVLYVGFLGRPLMEPNVSRLAELEHPVESLERLVTRELDLRAAMRRGPHWEWTLYQALSGDDDPLVSAAPWYAELTDYTDAPVAELQHIVLLAESGRKRQAGEAIARGLVAAPPRDRLAAWAATAYAAPAPGAAAGRGVIGEIRSELAPNWFADTLVRRIASRIGDNEDRARAEGAILVRGHRFLVRARIMMAVSIGLFAAGLIALFWMVARRARARVADAPLPPRWSGADGFALFVRGLGAPQAIALVAFVVLRRDTGLGTLLGMAADLPLFLWVGLYLHRRRDTMRSAFGLVPARRGWVALVGVTAALIALAMAGDAAIELLSRRVHVETHWTDGFSEQLLWSGRRRAMLEAIGASLWAPIVEEITFRGLLYATLRTRLGIPEAALLSALVFTLPHGYAVAGSASVLVSGLLWALAYERTRSLVPGLLAHAANNLLSTLWTVAMLR